MTKRDDEAAKARLREKYPDWDVWYVPHALDGGATWVARLKGDDIKNTVHADNPEHLDQHIALRVEDLAADARLADEAARDLTGESP